ncbi:ATP-grasp domain-containing protein [Nostoc sp. UIC 10630]|uniref:ATP-grasp domain-containing protein n=1 Tax=Nostoc sp. UIC 10630 TaxID=2100146 RepID=UPI0013D4588E|nr:ATP-grasp domain-containing protein [Nostoc sp. UIC 10630]NEU83678.1 ATP-grasp domain-containing protein [Nostoc sp. UIC 10630]
MFVQVGATRDGLDPYLDASSRRDMKAVLIETPDYLQWRQNLGRRTFDIELPVNQPNDPNQILNVLSDLSKNVKLILPGFESYVKSVYAVAETWKIPPWQETIYPHFVPPNKWEQRRLLSQKASVILQPGYMILSLQDANAISLENLKYPLVIKPVNSGGGLGVFLVKDSLQLDKSLAELKKLTNYDGNIFDKIIVEEYISGVEYSVQGISQEGTVVIITVCEKFILKEDIPGTNNISGFREIGHIAACGSWSSSEIQQFAQSCIDAVGYYKGPFHIDVIQNDQGIYFIEMGFRLSGGGLVNLIEKVTGINWGESSFAVHLENRFLLPFTSTNNKFIGQIIAISPEEMRMAEHLYSMGLPITIEKFPPLKPLSQLPRFIPKSLAADVMRHTGSLGRITVSAQSLIEVKNLLQKCISVRLNRQN